MPRFHFLFLLFTFLFSGTLLAEDSPVETRQAQSHARLVWDKDSVRPNGTLRVGLHIQLDPHWHTYWENPGDSGAPIRFQWNLPKGWSAGPILFPPPQRIPTPPLETFGHEGELLVYSLLQLPSHLENSSLLQLEAEWLVCRDVCIPAFHKFSVTLPSNAKASPSKEAELFEKAQASHPQQLALWTAQYEKVDSQYEIKIEAPEKFEFLDLFPYPHSPLANTPLELKSQNDHSALLSTKVSRYENTSNPLVLVKYKDSQGSPRFGILSLQNDASSFLPFLFLAFLGGLILNLMPCVFPVISIKFFSLVRQSGGQNAEIRKGNLLYSLGVLVSFWALALLLFALQKSGEALGWGFQLQSPYFVVFLALLFSLMAFNFLGWFEFQVPLPGAGKWLSKEGGMGHFLTGVLSCVVASPCTAPFMGVSLGFALSQSLPVMLSIFSFLGLGLAFPYLLLALYPDWIHRLPRPGAWMESLKTFMAFPLLGTVIWLLWTLSFQVDSTAVTQVWVAILVLGIMIWSWKYLPIKSKAGRWILTLLLLLLSFKLSFGSLNTSAQIQSPTASDAWQKFSPEVLNQLRSENKAVFVDFTAAWCITCQVNKKVTFASHEVQEFIEHHKIQLLRADWTNRDPIITSVLKEYDRAGVPLYLFFAPGQTGPGRVLPEILTPSIFLENLSESLKLAPY